MHADEPRSKQRQTGPARDPKDRRQDDLRAPLLVDPGQTLSRERPGVDTRDRAPPKDLVARAEVIGEVDRRQAREERGEDGQCDREEDPESAQ